MMGTLIGIGVCVWLSGAGVFFTAAAYAIYKDTRDIRADA